MGFFSGFIKLNMLSVYLAEKVSSTFYYMCKGAQVSISAKSEIILEINFFNLLETVLILFKRTSFMLTKLSDIVVYDRPVYSLRYVISYILSNVDRELKVRVRFAVNSTNIILGSISSIIKSANWAEREALDMFGVKFWGNKDCRRIIGDYGFWGFPGRKDFPLVGIYSYFYVVSFLRVFRVRGMLSDFWSIYFQKGIYNQC